MLRSQLMHLRSCKLSCSEEQQAKQANQPTRGIRSNAAVQKRSEPSVTFWRCKKGVDPQNLSKCAAFCDRPARESGTEAANGWLFRLNLRM